VFPETLVASCNQAVALANGNGTTFACVGGATAENCMDKINAGQADLTKVGAERGWLTVLRQSVDTALWRIYNPLVRRGIFAT
jgi:hypothetical protein